MPTTELITTLYSGTKTTGGRIPSTWVPLINADNARGWSPYLSPDGKYFFFMAVRTNEIEAEDWNYRTLTGHLQQPKQRKFGHILDGRRLYQKPERESAGGLNIFIFADLHTAPMSRNTLFLVILSDYVFSCRNFGPGPGGSHPL